MDPSRVRDQHCRKSHLRQARLDYQENQKLGRSRKRHRDYNAFLRKLQHDELDFRPTVPRVGKPSFFRRFLHSFPHLRTSGAHANILHAVTRMLANQRQESCTDQRLHAHLVCVLHTPAHDA